MSTKSVQTLAQIDACLRFIRKKTNFKPEFCCVLGTGLGFLANQVKVSASFDYSKLPNFPGLKSQKGKLILGELEGKRLAVLEGRFHLYDGYTAEDIAFPIRLCRFLGAQNLIVTNASGGLNPSFKRGDIVAIEDHIDFLNANPLTGPNDERIGPRFPDMSEPYSRDFLKVIHNAAKSLKLSVAEGVYLAIQGPNLETRAEYRMIRGFGADLVGMSTVPEVITAVHSGMKVLGLSVVTDLCDPENLKPVNIREIIQVANLASPKLDQLIRKFLKMI